MPRQNSTATPAAPSPPLTVRQAAGKMLSPPAVAAQLGVRTGKVYGWIERGELRGINLAENPAGRPRWKIAPDDLDDFLARRTAVPRVRTLRMRRKRAAEYIKYY